jgi:hypothetical protein
MLMAGGRGAGKMVFGGCMAFFSHPAGTRKCHEGEPSSNRAVTMVRCRVPRNRISSFRDEMKFRGNLFFTDTDCVSFRWNFVQILLRAKQNEISLNSLILRKVFLINKI